MKIKPEHYGTLHAAITLTRAKKLLPELDHYTAQGLSPRRWRWDLLRCAERERLLPRRFVVDTLYPYCNDNHIDTALYQATL